MIRGQCKGFLTLHYGSYPILLRYHWSITFANLLKIPKTLETFLTKNKKNCKTNILTNIQTIVFERITTFKSKYKPYITCWGLIYLLCLWFLWLYHYKSCCVLPKIIKNNSKLLNDNMDIALKSTYCLCSWNHLFVSK